MTTLRSQPGDPCGCHPDAECRCYPDDVPTCAVHPDRPALAQAGGEWSCSDCVDEVYVIEWIEALTGAWARAVDGGVIELDVRS